MRRFIACSAILLASCSTGTPSPASTPDTNPPSINIHTVGGEGGGGGGSSGDSGTSQSGPAVEKSIRIVCTDLTDLLHKSASGKLSEKVLGRYVNKWHALKFQTNSHYISTEVGFLWSDIYETPPSATGLQFAKDLRLMGRDCNRAGFHVPFVS
jgi:hypothetical protein